MRIQFSLWGFACSNCHSNFRNRISDGQKLLCRTLVLPPFHSSHILIILIILTSVKAYRRANHETMASSTEPYVWPSQKDSGGHEAQWAQNHRGMASAYMSARESKSWHKAEIASHGLPVSVSLDHEFRAIYPAMCDSLTWTSNSSNDN